MSIKMCMMDEVNKSIKDEVFEFFNDDVVFLVVLILIQGFNRGRNVFVLTDFIKGDYSKIDGSIEKTCDGRSAESFALSNVLRIIKSLGFGKIEEIYIENMGSLRDVIVEKIMDCERPKKPEDKEELVDHFSRILADVDKIMSIERQGKKIARKNGEIVVMDRLYLTEENFRYIDNLRSYIASSLEMEIKFIPKNLKKIMRVVTECLNEFCQDVYLENTPYRITRLYFSKQVENFVNYLDQFPVVGKSVNIPFDVLQEKGFEFIKIASYFELKEKMKVRDWENMSLWNVEFSQIPITVDSLISDENNGDSVDSDVKSESKRNEEKYLKTIHLVTESVAVRDVIFLVLNEQYQMPFRFSTNNKEGKETAIKLLHNIAYLADAPEKKVSYSKRTADNINNGIFRNKSVTAYMKTNNLKKPTLVKKSEDGKILVLGNGICLETILVSKVPLQHQNRYRDKRK